MFANRFRDLPCRYWLFQYSYVYTFIFKYWFPVATFVTAAPPEVQSWRQLDVQTLSYLDMSFNLKNGYNNY